MGKEEGDTYSRRELLRTVVLGSAVVAAETLIFDPPKPVVDVYNHIKELRELGKSKWLHTQIHCETTKDGKLVRYVRDVFGDSLGAGFRGLGQTYTPADGLFVDDINNYLSSSWELRNFAVIGSRAEDVLHALSPGQPGFNSLMDGSPHSLSLSLLGNDIGYNIFSSYDDTSIIYEIVDNPLQLETIGFARVVADSIREYTDSMQKVILRFVNSAHNGADIRHLHLPGPPDFSQAPAISFFVPEKNGHHARLVRIPLKDQRSRDIAHLMSLEILLSMTKALDNITHLLPFPVRITDNLGIADFGDDQHLTLLGYTNESHLQQNGFFANFDGIVMSFYDAIRQRRRL